MGRPLIDLTDQVFGRLLALYMDHKDKFGQPMWRCLCACGETTTVQRSNLKSGATLSCGCLHSERARERYKQIGRLRQTHGEAGATPEYRAWASMKRRCFNPNVWNYKNYGGRGITVCPQWAGSFEAFLADVGRKPSQKHVLDKINNNGNYEPGNVRWATMSESNKNRRPFKRGAIRRT
jgi:hypothetical protein